jgi:hypothetical protein
MKRRFSNLRTWAAAAAAAAPATMIAAVAQALAVDEDIRDIRGPKQVLADWVLPVAIAAALLIAALIYGIWRRRRNRYVAPLLPFEIALQRLDEIRALMQPAHAREFSTAVSDIVRSYIEQRFEVTATRRTTEEFLRDLLQSSNASLAKHQGLLGDFLFQCDAVKFAALSLTLQSMETLRQSARNFVIETAKPEPPVAAEEANDSLPAT